jgi:hypothetical protein
MMGAKDKQQFMLHMQELATAYDGHDYSAEIMEALPEEKLINLIGIIRRDNLPYNVYLHVMVIYMKLKTLEVSGLLYSKNFERDLDTLKEKVDLIASLSPEKVIIKIPSSLPDLQAMLYHRLNYDCGLSQDLTLDVIREVFDKRLFKGHYDVVKNDWNKLIESTTNLHNTSGLTPAQILKFRFDDTYIGNPSKK